MKSGYFWFVFIYKCFNNNPRIFLLSRHSRFSPVALKGIKPREFEMAKSQFVRMTGITEEDCFPNRFFESSHSFSCQKGAEKLVVSATSIRLLGEVSLENMSDKLKGEWFSKEEVLEKLQYDKKYFRAFKNEFRKDTFWEGLDTTDSKTT